MTADLQPTICPFDKTPCRQGCSQNACEIEKDYAGEEEYRRSQTNFRRFIRGGRRMTANLGALDLDVRAVITYINESAGRALQTPHPPPKRYRLIRSLYA